MGPTQRTVLVTRSLRLSQVSGFSCINPIALLGETARTSPRLSTWVTESIHDVGMSNRCEASAINAPKGLALSTTLGALGRVAPAAGRAPRPGP